MDIAINTAQNVNIDCKPAGLINRIGATCIDFLAMIAIFILGTFLLKLFPHSGKQHQNLLLILAILLTFYHLIIELTSGWPETIVMGLYASLGITAD